MSEQHQPFSLTVQSDRKVRRVRVGLGRLTSWTGTVLYSGQTRRRCDTGDNHHGRLGVRAAVERDLCSADAV